MQLSDSSLIYSISSIKSELQKIPKTGPLLLITNHTSVFDGPLIYVFLQPCNVLAMAKKELWNNWFTKMVMNAWSSIPVR